MVSVSVQLVSGGGFWLGMKADGWDEQRDTRLGSCLPMFTALVIRTVP
jgi:hypothetical protein